MIKRAERAANPSYRREPVEEARDIIRSIVPNEPGRDPVRAEHRFVFSFEAHSRVMSLLVFNVPSYDRHLRLADGEGAIAPLPLKMAASFRFRPFGRICLEVPDKVVQPMRSSQSNEKMNVFGHPVDCIGGSAKALYCASEVPVKMRFQVLRNERCSPFRREDQVVSEMCVGHFLLPRAREGAVLFFVFNCQFLHADALSTRSRV